MRETSQSELMTQLLHQDSLNDMEALVPLDPAEAKNRDTDDIDDDLGEVHGVPVDPWCKGTLNYLDITTMGGRPYESCLCCSPTLPSWCYKKRIGNAYLCCQTTGKRSRVICMCGAGWGTMIITYVLLFGTSGVVFAATFWTVPWYISLICSVVWLVTWIVLGRTSFGDPGIFPHYAKPKSLEWRFCTQTSSFRPADKNIQYCSDTGVLIEDIDHFCPWTGTTIAGKNLCFFYAFFAMSVVTMVATGVCGFWGFSQLNNSISEAWARAHQMGKNTSF